jgi:hypothetical protein
VLEKLNSFLMGERRYQDLPVIRLHHLWPVEDFSLRYLKEFNGIKPWELKEDMLPRVKEFLLKDDQDFGNEMAREIFRLECAYQADPQPDFLKQLDYLHDVFGDSEEEHNLVAQKRNEAFLKIFEIARKNRHARIYLTGTRDDFCRACIVGNHCVDPAIRFRGLRKKDKGYEDAVLEIGRKNLNNYAGSGKIGRDKIGTFIEAELLFDKRFYILLKGN